MAGFNPALLWVLCVKLEEKMRLKTALLVLCIVVVNACSPQVTVTSEATVTLTPPPHPHADSNPDHCPHV